MNKLRQPSEVILSNGRNLEEVLELHMKWLNDEEGGKRANLSEEDLSCVDLRCVDLSYVNLNCADLKGTILRCAILEGAILKGADLSYSDLKGANLNNTKFYLTNLYKTEGDFVGVENIGSRNDTTHYFYKDNRIICGCFDGTMEQFEEKVKKSYGEDEVEYKEYMIAIDTLKRLAELYINN